MIATTIVIAIILFLLCAAMLAVGKLITGKNKFSCKRCGTPEKKEGCKLCKKPPNEDD